MLLVPRPVGITLNRPAVVQLDPQPLVALRTARTVARLPNRHRSASFGGSLGNCAVNLAPPPPT
jgi:hypothetical protein